MPKFRSFHARIRVDGEDLPEYDVQIDENKKQVSCWIPSEAGKNFVVWCSNTGPLVGDVGGYVKLDGLSAGLNAFSRGSKSEWIRSYCRTSPTTVRDFSFASISFTDDDVYLNSSAANLGEIKIEIWTIVNVNKTPDFIDPTGTSNAKVHERSKKIGAHRVQFGDLRRVPYAEIICYSCVDRLATFVFRYRLLGILQANGIAPPASPPPLPKQNKKRKLSQSDAKGMDSSEPEIDQHVEELKADIAVFSQNLSALQDKLKRVESRRAKKIKVKIEKREHSPLLNEVIDLT